MFVCVVVYWCVCVCMHVCLCACVHVCVCVAYIRYQQIMSAVEKSGRSCKTK